MTLETKLRAVKHLVRGGWLSQRRACQLLGLARSVARPATAGEKRAGLADGHAGGDLQLPVSPTRTGIRRRAGVVHLSASAADDHGGEQLAS